MSHPSRKRKLKVTISPIPWDSAIKKPKYSTKRRSSTLPLSKSNDLSPSTPPACSSSISTSSDLLASFPAVQTSADSTGLPTCDQPLPTPQATSTPPSCSSALPSFWHVFSATCPREQMWNCKLPPVDCSITVDQNKLVRLTSSSVCTSVASLCCESGSHSHERCNKNNSGRRKCS